MIKNFILDTNILLHSPNAIFGFDDNNIIITGTVLQELDKKKELGGEIGYNARQTIRNLDFLRQRGNLTEGVSLPTSGMIFVYPDGVKKENLPTGYSMENPDNRILSACIEYGKYKSPVILVTNDVSMRINASALGIYVEDYKNDQVKETDYMGYRDLYVPKSTIDMLYSKKQISDDITEEEIKENEFVHFVAIDDTSSSALAIHKYGHFNILYDQTTFGGIRGLNMQQHFALSALKAPVDEIALVILIGVPGTAKTLLSLGAGMEYTYSVGKFSNERYNKILLSRPNGIGYSNIGFLPGGLDQKLSPLMASYYDNMEILLSADGKSSRDEVQTQMEDILESGTVELCSLDFIRGRSLKNTYIICDEAQNASRTLIRDVITRAGEGSKVVIAGDPGQIDVPSLDSRNNGLAYAASVMAGDPTTAIIKFTADQSVRSNLAKAAIRRMKF